MELELQSLNPISPPDSRNGHNASAPENDNSESQSLLLGRPCSYRNGSKSLIDLEEIVTERPVQSANGNSSNGAENDVATGEVWIDVLYVAIVNNDVATVAYLLQISDGVKAEFIKQTFPYSWDFDAAPIFTRDEPAQPSDVNVTVPIRSLDLLSFDLDERPENVSWSILHLASSHGHEAMVNLLVLAGADPLAPDALGRTPLDVAGCNLYERLRQWDSISTLRTIHEWSRVINILLRHDASFSTKILCKDTKFYSLLLAELVDVERSDLPIVRELLDAGALSDPTDYTTWEAIEKIVEKQAIEELQLILHYSGHIYATIALLAAVKAGWIDSVRVALLAGASIVDRDFTLKQTQIQSNFGIGRRLPLQVAAISGNIEIIKLILRVAKFNTTDTENYNELCQHFPEAPKSLESRRRYFRNLCQYTQTFEDILNLNDGYNHSALYYTVQYNHLECFKMFMENEASLICHEPTLLHLAADGNNIEIAKLLIDLDKSLVQATDLQLRQPLHNACESYHREMVFLLLKNGGDLSKKDKDGKTPIHIIDEKYPNSEAFLKDIFDSAITCDFSNLGNTNHYEVNYRMITKTNEQEFDVIQTLVEVKLTDSLKHPLLESFIYLEWTSFVYLYYIALAFHIAFVTSLNLYIVPFYYYQDTHEEMPMFLKSKVWYYLIFVTAAWYIVDNVIYVKESRHFYPHRFIMPFHVWVKMASTILYICLPIAIYRENPITSEWARFFASLAVIWSLVEIMCLISINLDWGFYVLIIGKTAWKIVKLLLFSGLIILIVGFALNFLILFGAQEPFNGFRTSFMKTFVMVTEVDYSNTYNATNYTDFSILSATKQFGLIVFLIVIPWTSFALINSFAINDLEKLEKTGHVAKLKKQAEFLASVKNHVILRYIKRLLLPSSWRQNNIGVKTTTVQNSIIVANYYETNPVLPKRIKESITENVMSRIKELKKEGNNSGETADLDVNPNAFNSFAVVMHGEHTVLKQKAD